MSTKFNVVISARVEPIPFWRFRTEGVEYQTYIKPTVARALSNVRGYIRYSKVKFALCELVQPLKYTLLTVPTSPIPAVTNLTFTVEYSNIQPLVSHSALDSTHTDNDRAVEYLHTLIVNTLSKTYVENQQVLVEHPAIVYPFASAENRTLGTTETLVTQSVTAPGVTPDVTITITII